MTQMSYFFRSVTASVTPKCNTKCNSYNAYSIYYIYIIIITVTDVTLNILLSHIPHKYWCIENSVTSVTSVTL